MIPPNEIMTTWKKFNHFPMDTLTKAWFFQKGTEKKQRDVSLIKEHYQQYRITGNCFDLAIWLLDEFKKDGITAFPIGHHIGTDHAHVAVIALDEHGHRYLCDLGDQWINPILIDEDSNQFTNEKMAGYFPGALIQVKPERHSVTIHYHRPNNKTSSQNYLLDRMEINEFFQAAEHCQQVIRPKPLVECRLPLESEIAHWEFYDWDSFLSTTTGLIHEPKLDCIEDWATRINKKTGYDLAFLQDALSLYKFHQF
ncbi:hypothetical protein OEV98_14040 [Caldibacillus lycopersici]|uniref:Uncharacterized protein n=1 Tax=Perspicuibacillus lycopersici TaxID=1325689 RepID=A0AAE3IU39_9BACI|nr:hypothetical protein [Perspicuibacillus lycopersici]MCU9614660.1 hypothetical protein [Perspicuibacillus lycopersici]